MKTKIFLTAIVLFLTLPAAADFRPITQGYEVALGDIRLPRNEGGTISFKACSDCEYETKIVLTDAQWLYNGTNMTLDQFRTQVAKLPKIQNKRAVTVTRHIESNRITKVSIFVRDDD